MYIPNVIPNNKLGTAITRKKNIPSPKGHSDKNIVDKTPNRNGKAIINNKTR
jgi:hypothetical protein